MSNLPKVSFGLVNCNRLFYLKSCLESLIYCTEDYDNKEFLVVDNASVEKGTEEYLEQLRDRGIKVHREEARDPSNEFARGLNTICEKTDGDFVVPLQSDMQFFVRGGWLENYVNFFEKNHDKIGCISLDAQRKIRLDQGNYLFPQNQTEFKFVYSKSYSPIHGAADVMYSRETIKEIYPWNLRNANHEGGQDSETKMLQKVNDILTEKRKTVYLTMPIFPVSAAIYTDARGTNARIRGDKRYGDYWPTKEDNFRYYKIWEYEEAIESSSNKDVPFGIEFTANPVGWKKPLDKDGNWLKNPIRPESCSENDYENIE